MIPSNPNYFSVDPEGYYQLPDDFFSDLISPLEPVSDDIPIPIAIKYKTPLHEACATKDVLAIQQLIQQGADINAQDETGKTPLMIAATAPCFDGVRVLTNNKADLNLQDDEGNTALHHAISCHQVGVVYSLVDAGANVNIQNKNGYTALHFAAELGLEKAVIRLLQVKEIDISLLSVSGKSAEECSSSQAIKKLFENHSKAQNASLITIEIPKETTLDLMNKAVERGDTQEVRHLISVWGYKPIPEGQLSPLCVAARLGHGEITAQLLQGVGQKIFQRDLGPALHIAAKAGYLHIVTLLIKYKADLNTVDSHGYTPLQYAVSEGHYVVANWLIDAGAIVHTNTTTSFNAIYLLAKTPEMKKLVTEDHHKKAELKNKILNTVVTKENQQEYWNAQLCEACKQRSISKVKNWVDAGADVNTQDLCTGFSPLAIAVLNWDSYTFNYLISQGARKDIQAAYYAAKGGNFKCIYDLLDKKSNIWFGKSLFSFGEDVFEVIIRMGINLDLKDSEGNTYLHYAVELGHKEAISLLLKNKAKILFNNQGQRPTDLTTDQSILDLFSTTPQPPPPPAKLSETPLTELNKAIEQADIEKAKRLIIQWRIRQEIPKGQPSPLCVAARFGHADIVALLLRAKIGSVNHEGEESKSPLHQAAIEGYLPVVALLVKYKANLHATCSNGYTPLQYAVREGKYEVVKWLLDAGALIQCNPTKSGQTTRSLAKDEQMRILLQDDAKNYASKQKVLSLGYLQTNKQEYLNAQLCAECKKRATTNAIANINSGANVNTIDPYTGHSPLTIAALLHDVPTVEHLIREGANRSLVALFYAALGCHLKLLPILFDKDSNIWFGHNFTSFRKDVVQELIRLGLDLDMQDSEGNTYLHYAVKKNCPGIISLLLQSGAKMLQNNQKQLPINLTNDLTILNLFSQSPAPSSAWAPAPAPAPAPATMKIRLDEVDSYIEGEGNAVAVRLASRLQKLIEYYYNEKHYQAMNEAFIHDGGQGKIDVTENTLHEGLTKEDWIRPFYELIQQSKTILERKISLRIIGMFISIYQFYDPIPGDETSSISDSEVFANESCLHFIHNLLKSNAKFTQRYQPASAHLLPQVIAAEIAPTALMHRHAEARLIVESPQKFTKSNHSKRSIAPCFILTNHGDNVRVYLLRAHKSDVDDIRRYLVDQNNESLNYFEENFVPRSQWLESTEHYVTVSHESAVTMVSNDEAYVIRSPNKKTAKLDQVNFMKACKEGRRAYLNTVYRRSQLDLNASDSTGYTPLTIALKYGHHGCVSELVLKGADINKMDGGGRVPLSVALEEGHEKCVRYLIKQKNINLDQRDTKKGYRPLHYAVSVKEPSIELIRLLLRSGADPSLKTLEGIKARRLTKSQEIRKILDDYSSGTKRAKNGKSPEQPPQNPTATTTTTAAPVTDVAVYAAGEGRELVVKTFDRLYHLVKAHYGKKHIAAFCELFIRNGGRWGVDFAGETPGGLTKAEWLKPFEVLLNEMAVVSDENAIAVVIPLAMNFFGFYDSQAVEASNYLDQVLMVNGQFRALLPQLPAVDLPKDIATNELASTFLWLKLSVEWKVLTAHPHAFAVTVTRPLSEHPCFVLANDSNKVRVFTFKAHKDIYGFVNRLAMDTHHQSYQFFTQKYVPEASILHRGRDFLTISYPDSFKVKPLDGAIILSRRGVKEYFTGDGVVPPPAVRPSKRTSRENDREDSGRKHRHKKRRDLRHKTTSLTYFDLDDAPNEVTRPNKRGPGHKLREKPAKRGVKEYREPTLDEGYLPLDHMAGLGPKGHRPKAPPSSNSGPLPVVGISDTMPREELSNFEITPENFYDIIADQSIRIVRNAVAQAVEKEAVVLKKIEPLHFPIETALAELPPAKPHFNLNRRLKPYQIEGVQRILRSREAGLSQLLSLEMGMGKTMTFAEVILFIISECLTPQTHIVAAPVSLIAQHEEDLPEHIQDSLVVAWQLSGKHAKPSLYAEFYDEFMKEASDDKAFEAFLRILPYFTDPLKHAYFKFIQFFHKSETQVRTLAIVKLHLEHVEKVLVNCPETEPAIRNGLRKIYSDSGLLHPDSSYDELFRLFNQPKTGSELARLCILAGRVLDLHPEKIPMPDPLPEVDETQLAALRQLGFTPTKVKGMFSTKVPDASEPLTGHIIVILTLNEIFDDLGLNDGPDDIPTESHLKNMPIGSFIVDEASVAHKVTSKVSIKLEKAIHTLKVRSDVKGKNNTVLITGTPIENDPSDIWTLLRIANGPDKLDSVSFNAIKRLGKRACEMLIELADKEYGFEDVAAREAVIKSFAHHARLRQLILEMVYSKSKTDPDVIEQWAGRIPTRVDHTVVVTLPQSVLKDLNEVRRADFSKKTTFINEYRQRAKGLVHPDLSHRNLQWEKRRKNPFLDIFRRKTAASHGEIMNWIFQSHSLKAFFGDDKTQRAITEKQKSLVFVEYRIQADMLKKAIKFIARTQHNQDVKVYIFHGNLTRNERLQMVDDFQNKNDGRSAFMVTMMKCGSVGMNIGKAKNVFFKSLPWNPGVQDQASDRAIRANFSGKRHIIDYFYEGLQVSEHTKIIQGMKRSIKKFLFGTVASNEELFKLWLEVLQSMTLHKYLNHEAELVDAHEKNEAVTRVVNRMEREIPSDYLSFALNQAGASSIQGAQVSSTSTSTGPRVLAPVGFHNTLFNCWCISLLQMVVSIPSLREAYTTFANTFRNQQANDMTLEFDRPYRKYLRRALEIYDDNIQTGTAIDASVSQKVRLAISYFYNGISNDVSVQEDVCEALMLILGACVPAENSLFAELELSYQGTNREGYHSSYKTGPSTGIILELQGKESHTFDQLLREYFDVEIEDNYTEDGEMQTAVMRETKQYIHAPAEFLLTLQRFNRSLGETTKNCRDLDVPLKTTLPEFSVKGDDGTHEYELDAFVVHDGMDFNYGHFYTFKKVEGRWWRCNDNSVSEVSEAVVVDVLHHGSLDGRTSYLHHYRKV